MDICKIPKPLGVSAAGPPATPHRVRHIESRSEPVRKGRLFWFPGGNRKPKTKGPISPGLRMSWTRVVVSDVDGMLDVHGEQ
jgi:hypothetical protein